MTTVERLWNPFQTCSTADNRPVELKFPDDTVELGYFSSSQGRWIYADGKPFPERVYPTHWRSPAPLRNRMKDCTRPTVIDFDDGEISARLDGKELRGWSYKDDAERRQKMLQAREYVEGWCAAALVEGET